MNIMQSFANSYSSLLLTIQAINVILHVVFAGSVAKDAGRLAKEGRTTWLVSGITWAFATLIGGVFVAAIYWFIHYSNIRRGSANM
jgi:hypothetical protein